jgi:hypothetical protein
MQRVYAALDAAPQATLRRDLTRLWEVNNHAGDGTTRVDAECLEVLATRA